MEPNEIYEKEVISDKNHSVKIELKSIENKLDFKSFFIEDYMTTTYVESFSLEELKKKSKYYLQFDESKMIIREIKSYSGERKIVVKEEEDQIAIIFPIASAVFETITFILKLKEKTDKEKLKEYEQAFEKYKNDIKTLKENYRNEIMKLNQKINNLEERFIIPGFDTHIIKNKNEKEIIKMWISPHKKITAILIYSFYNIKREKNFCDVNKFHEKCDNKPNLLVLCQSNNEIFGGFTPLPFLNDNSYGYDNDSFVFSINKLKKYPKEDQNNSCSTWKYQNYGPCFSYDLCFQEYSMNRIYFEQKRYTIPKDFINKGNTSNFGDWICLKSLEIFEIRFE